MEIKSCRPEKWRDVKRKGSEKEQKPLNTGVMGEDRNVECKEAWQFVLAFL